MQKDDRFAAVLEQLVREIQREHQRQLDALNAEITSLRSGLAARESPAEAPHGQLPRSRPGVYTGHEGAIQKGRAAPEDRPELYTGHENMSRKYLEASEDSRTSSEASGSPDAAGGVSTAQGNSPRCAGYTRAATMAEAMRRMGTRVPEERTRTFAISASHEHSYYEPSSCRVIACIERVVRSWAFDTAVFAVVLLNLVVTSLEAQYTCAFVAEEWGYSSGPQASPDERAVVSRAFAVLETVFGAGFVVEVALRIAALRSRFFLSRWNCVDLALVTGWFLALSLMLTTLSPMMFRLFRIVRIFRLVRLVRVFKEFDTLCLMITAMKKGALILGWATCLISFSLVFLALLLHEFLLNTYLQDRSAPFSERQEIYRYFGSFTKTLFSMFELTLANWPPIARALSENVSEWFMLVTVLHKLTIGFALVGIINAVFIQETFKVAQEDTEILWRRAEVARKQHAKNMRGLMQAADLDHDGWLDAAEFRRMFQNPALRSWLASQDIHQEDADELFDLLADGDGRLSVEQVRAGMARLKGTARAVDLHILMKANRRHAEEQLSRLRGGAPAIAAGNSTGARP